LALAALVLVVFGAYDSYPDFYSSKQGGHLFSFNIYNKKREIRALESQLPRQSCIQPFSVAGFMNQRIPREYFVASLPSRFSTGH